MPGFVSACIQKSLGLFTRPAATGIASGRAARVRARVTERNAWLDPLETRTLLSGSDNNTIVKMDTDYGAVFVELYDQAAPVTVANFLNYVNSGRYDGTFFHRLVKGFVLQGGGFKLNQGSTNPTAVTTDPPIIKENTGKSNIKLTIAMARTDQLNSATCQFYFNLVDNNTGPNSLDTLGGGYAVFGEVIGGWTNVETMAGLRVFNLDNGGTFKETPVRESYDPNGSTILPSMLVTLQKATVVNRADYRLVTPGGPIGGAANGQDQIVTAAVGTGGRAILFTTTASGWAYTDLKAATGSPAISGNVETFYDAKTGLAYATAVASTGLILYSRNAGGVWSFQNLTTALPGSVAPSSELTVFTSIDGYSHIAGVTADGKVVEYRQAGENSTWEFHSISDDLAAQSLTTPAFAGRLISYVTSWNGMNVAGLDSSGDIQVVWWSPGMDRWTTSNLSDIVNAPSLSGGLTAYLTSWGGINIAGVNIAGEVSVTWWVPSFGGEWRTDNLTTQFNGALMNGATISSYVTPWGGLNIAGLDVNGKLTIYWWAPGLTNWSITDLSSFVAGSPTVTGRIKGAPSPTGTISLMASSTLGDIVRFTWKPSGTWNWENVSYLGIVG